MFCDFWAEKVRVLWLNTQLPAQRISQQVQPARRTRPAPARIAVRVSAPANAGTRNPRGLTSPVQDSNRYTTTDPVWSFWLESKMW